MLFLLDDESSDFLHNQQLALVAYFPRKTLHTLLANQIYLRKRINLDLDDERYYLLSV
jgi:hypothetical protein